MDLLLLKAFANKYFKFLSYNFKTGKYRYDPHKQKLSRVLNNFYELKES